MLGGGGVLGAARMFPLTKKQNEKLACLNIVSEKANRIKKLSGESLMTAACQQSKC